jgi:adenine specific DNA methylase Mod
VITLDRITPEIIDKILRHKNLRTQVKEWEELGIIKSQIPSTKSQIPSTKSQTNSKSQIQNSKLNLFEGRKLKKEFEHLPIDTKYFKDLELEILSQFEDLDKSLDGWLIKSENYQALNTILPKFKERVQTIYIDPPFNLGTNADYFYNVNYKDANWATLLENRLRIAKDWLNKKGSIFVRCDYNGNLIVRCLMDGIFGNENFRNEIVIKRGEVPKGEVNKLLTGTDSLFYFSITESNIFYTPKKQREKRDWLPMHLPQQRTTYELQVREFFGKKLLPPKGRHWALSQQAIDQAIKNGLIRINEEKEYIDLQGNLMKGMPEILQSGEEKLTSNWTDIPSYTARAGGFQTENSEILLKRVIESTSNEGNLVMDFFLGSGTTAAVSHKLGRKWIGVEMGEHFYSVVLPRMKKVLAYDKSGISKEVKEYQGGGFFKYYELEQYEEALANCKYGDSDLFNSPSKTPYQEYVFMKDEKMLKSLEIDYEKNKVKVDLSKLYPNIDIAETLSNLTGKWIKKISDDEVEFEDGKKIDIKNLDYKFIKPLIWWE